MSMNVTDYSQRLADSREKYSDSAKELKKSYESSKKDMQNTHDVKEKGQAEAYANQQRATEKRIETTKDARIIKTQDDLARIKKEFVDKNSTQRTDFEARSAKDRAKFSRRVDDLNQSYNNSVKGIDEKSRQDMQRVSDRLEQRLENSNVEKVNTIAKLVDQSDAKYQEFRDHVASEKKQQTLASNDKYNKMFRDKTQESTVDKEVFRDKLVSVQKAYANKDKYNKEQFEQTLANQKANNSDHTKKIVQSYTDKAGDIKRSGSLAGRQQKEIYEDRIAGMNERHRKSTNLLQRKIDETTNSGGRGNSGTSRLKAERAKFAKTEKRLNNLVSDTNDNAQIDKENTWNLAKQSMNNQSVENQKKMHNQDKINAKFVADNIERSRTENQAVINQHSRDVKKSQLKSENDLTIQDKKFKQKYDSQRNSMANQMKLMQQKNIETISEIQEDQAQEKTQYFEKMKREFHAEKEQIAGALKSKFSKKTDSLNQKIDNIQKDKLKEQEKFESKINNIKAKTAEELNMRRELESKRRKEDMRLLKKSLTAKDEENAKSIANMRGKFTKEIVSEKHNHEIALAKMIQRYETRLKQMGHENKVNLEREMSQARDNYEHLGKTSTSEREAMRNKYELKIEQLKQANEKEREISQLRITQAYQSAKIQDESAS